MRITVRATDAALSSMAREIKTTIDEAVPKVELAMAEKFQECVLANFGASGPYRPWSGWPPLSPAYAKKVGRTYATLEVSGRLKGAVLIDLNGRNNFSVIAEDSNVPYATVHQYGGGNNIPAREYFPMNEDGEVTRQVQDIVLNAAYGAMQEALS